MTWHDMVEKYAGISAREKMLVLISGLAVICLLGSSLFIERQYKAWQQQLDISQVTISSLSKIQTDIHGVEQALSQEANGALKQQISQLTGKTEEIRQELLDEELALVAKSEMALTLKSLLQENSQLKLVSFQSLAPQAILLAAKQTNNTDQAQGQEQNNPLLYKHSIVVKISGRYFSILDFLREIEQTSDSILWQAVKYAVTDYPLAEATIEVFTLSTDKEFISVTD